MQSVSNVDRRYSTVGYGVFAPLTSLGRTLVVVLGIPGLVLVGLFVARIAAAVARARSRAETLHAKRVVGLFVAALPVAYCIVVGWWSSDRMGWTLGNGIYYAYARPSGSLEISYTALAPPRNIRVGFRATCLLRISTSWSRRRRGPERPRNIHVVVAAPPRPASTEYLRGIPRRPRRFVTLATIGFGDYAMDVRQRWVLLDFFVIFFGLGLVGAALGVMTDAADVFETFGDEQIADEVSDGDVELADGDGAATFDAALAVAKADGRARDGTTWGAALAKAEADGLAVWFSVDGARVVVQRCDNAWPPAPQYASPTKSARSAASPVKSARSAASPARSAASPAKVPASASSLATAPEPSPRDDDDAGGESTEEV